MDQRNAMPPSSPWSRRAVQAPAAGDAAPLHTPLIWAWGGALLAATTWLTGIIALFRGIGSLFH
jgi:hypothetical protein